MLKHGVHTRLGRFIFTFLVFSSLFLGSVSAQLTRLVIEELNEYGGQTIEYRDIDDSQVREFLDDDEVLVKQERAFTSQYPIDNGLQKIIIYYSFEKKIKEEKVYKNRVSQNTLIDRTIDYYDRFTGLKTKTENHFIDAYPGYNVIYREEGKKKRIEWYYPHNLNGIVKHVSHFDDREKAIKVESFYSEKTQQEEGFFKRVYYNEYSPNNYFRKTREEVYYTEEYSKHNLGVAKLIKHFHYRPGKLFDTEIHVFNRNDEKLFLDKEILAQYQK